MNHYNSQQASSGKTDRTVMEERERVCAHVCIYVCARERHQGKMKTYGTQCSVSFFFFFFFFIFWFHRRPKKPRFPQNALPISAHPNKLQVTTANRFTKHTDLHYNVTHWGPLTTENCTLLSSRRPAQPQAWCCPNSHHKFLKMITPFTFLYFLPRLFTTPILHIICSRQH